MGTTIWPTANDVAVTAGDGNKVLEQGFTKLLGTLIGQNYVVSGLTLPASDADLTIPVAAGIAVLDGRYVDIDATVNVVCADDDVNYIFLKLTKDGGGNADDAVFEANVTGTPPADSVLIGTATAASGAISSTTDERIFVPSYPHNHTALEDGGLLLSPAVKDASFHKVPKTFSTGNFDSRVAQTFTFTVTGTRIGDFSIQLNDGGIGQVGLGQMADARASGTGSGTQQKKFTLSVAAAADGGSSKSITVRWDEAG
jgi:hypothetical protein